MTASSPSGGPMEARAAPLTPMIVGLMIVLMVAIELALQAADRGWIGTLRWRSLAYQYGAFWPGLLDDWRANYTGQPATMFVTYAFLHSGLGHLVGNSITLWVVGGQICDRTGQRGFAAIFALSALGGSLCFAALSGGVQPMVGASGAIFGLIGIWTGWYWQDNPPGWQTAGQVLTILLGLALLNAALWWWQDGQLAWSTHLGGYVTGFALAGWVGRGAPPSPGKEQLMNSE